jgi:8-oxo-dGTP diphosphatase
MNSALAQIYGNKVRVRVCGLYWKDEKLLMVTHKGLNSAGSFWAPPGGGVEFGESLESALTREFREETGIEVKVDRFLFGCEFIKEPLHAIELFFEVTGTGGFLEVGNDPEVQIIEQIKLMDTNEIALIPAEQLHGIFRFVTKPEEMKELRGFYSI